MSGLTSQPSANSLYYALNGFPRNLRTDIEGLEETEPLLGNSSSILYGL